MSVDDWGENVSPLIAIAKAKAAAWQAFADSEGLFTITPSISNPNNEQNLLMIYLASPQFQEDLNEGIRQIHEDYGERILSMAKFLCPVDTGWLRDSLYLEVSDDGVSILSDCEYFAYVESRFGMVGLAYAIYEPLMLVEINAFIASKLVVT